MELARATGSSGVKVDDGKSGYGTRCIQVLRIHGVKNGKLHAVFDIRKIPGLTFSTEQQGVGCICVPIFTVGQRGRRIQPNLARTMDREHHVV